MARQRITQIELAQRLGISQSRLSRLLADGALTIDFMAEVAAALDVPVSAILGDPDVVVSDYRSNRSYSMLGAA
jgi:transcriptional regulator with XRE-family HTH domain